MITIIQMPVESMYQISGVYHPPNSLAQLSACLKKEGYCVKCFDISIELYNKRNDEYKNFWAIEQRSFWHNKEYVLKFFEDNIKIINEYVDLIINSGYKIVYFSIDSTSKFSSIEFAKLLKLKNKNIKIIFYGTLFFIFQEKVFKEVLDTEVVDFIIYGEYENTAIELTNNLFEKKLNNDFKKVKGVVFKNNNEIAITSERPLIKNLDELPHLDFEDFNFNKYDPPGHLKNCLLLETSRGCIFNCVFCGQRTYWKGFRTMSGKRIYEEIKFQIEKYPNFEQIEFLDLVFNGDINALKEFCDLMISIPIKKNLRWHSNMVIRSDMTEEVCKKMKQAGCWHITFGIESGSQKVLDKMRKKFNINDAEEVIKNVHNSGIRVTCNFMFGFPGETEEDFKQTLDFVKRNAKYIDMLYPSNTCFTIEPYSYLASHLDEFGIIPNPVHGQYWDSVDLRNTYPERLKRYETFISVANSLGMQIGTGLQTSIEQEKYYKLGFYYESKKDFKQAIDCFKKYLEFDPNNIVILNKLEIIKKY